MPHNHQIALVVKVAERCNLNCSYCYMYQFEQSWRKRPKFLSEEQTELLIGRVAEYLKDPSRSILIELHGGEPLLWGRIRMRAFFERCEALRTDGRLEIAIQTNGVLLDDEWLQLFSQFRVPWSISCDGPEAAHDKNRLFHSGKPSSGKVHDAIRLSVSHTESRKLFGGVLTVADLGTPASEVLGFFRAMGVRSADLLLPDRTKENPAEEEWSDWLQAALVYWMNLDDPEFDVRVLHDFIVGAAGVRSSLDYYGGDLSGLLVIETDGTIQLLDVLRICGEGADYMGLTLENDSLEFAVRRASELLPGPCAQCLSCPAFSACGGGYLPHRWDGLSFDNPSAYCVPLLHLYDQVVAEMRSGIASAAAKKFGPRPLSDYSELNG